MAGEGQNESLSGCALPRPVSSGSIDSDRGGGSRKRRPKEQGCAWAAAAGRVV